MCLIARAGIEASSAAANIGGIAEINYAGSSLTVSSFSPSVKLTVYVAGVGRGDNKV